MTISGARFANLIMRSFETKRWKNISQVCNKKTHPQSFDYRRYRKGRNRCRKCGAKLGKVKCIRQSFKDSLLDNLYRPDPILEFLRKGI